MFVIIYFHVTANFKRTFADGSIFIWKKKDVSKVYVELYKTSFSDARMPYFKLDFVKKQYQNIKVKLLKVLIV